METSMKAILESMRNGLIVSCQTSRPLNNPEYIGLLSLAVVEAGAVGIRANGPKNVAAIRKNVNVPIIGINKINTKGYDVYITPTIKSALEVINAGADIIAVDGRTIPRPHGITLESLIQEIHNHKLLVMADISTQEEGLMAAETGADILATTLSGYTPESPKLIGPDLELVEVLSQETHLPVICEGRYSIPDDVKAAFERGAYAVVVGKAITEPKYIVNKFIEAIPHSCH